MSRKTPGPGPRTGRPRSTTADRAILAATRAALVERGWGRLTMSDVAARAGVARTTLYRRWSGKNELVVDAVAAFFDERPELPDRGSLPADIEAVVLRFAALLERPESKAGLMAVITEATTDEALRRRVRSALLDRQKTLVLHGRERAQARGELPPDPPGAAGARRASAAVDLLFDVIAGSVLHRVLVNDEPVDTVWAHDFAHLLLAGLTSQTSQTRRTGQTSRAESAESG